METKEIKLSEFLDKVVNTKAISMDLTHEMLIGSFVALMLTDNEEVSNVAVTLLLSSFNPAVLDRHRKRAKHPLVGYKIIGDDLNEQQTITALNLAISGYGLMCPHCLYEQVKKLGVDKIKKAFIESFKTEYDIDANVMAEKLFEKLETYTEHNSNEENTSVN